MDLACIRGSAGSAPVSEGLSQHPDGFLRSSFFLLSWWGQLRSLPYGPSVGEKTGAYYAVRPNDTSISYAQQFCPSEDVRYTPFASYLELNSDTVRELPLPIFVDLASPCFAAVA